MSLQLRRIVASCVVTVSACSPESPVDPTRGTNDTAHAKAALRAARKSAAREAKNPACPALVSQTAGDVRVRRAGETTWHPVKASQRLCIHDRVFAGPASFARLLFHGVDETGVWVGAGSVFSVSREPPLSSRLAKTGQVNSAWVAGMESGDGVAHEGVTFGEGLQLDVFVREHRFAFPRGRMHVVADKFPVVLIFQTTVDYERSQRGGYSRGMLWKTRARGPVAGKLPVSGSTLIEASGQAALTTWSASQSDKLWRIPVLVPGSYVFQVFSEATRDRTVPLSVEVVRDSGRRKRMDTAALLPASISAGDMVVVP